MNLIINIFREQEKIYPSREQIEKINLFDPDFDELTAPRVLPQDPLPRMACELETKISPTSPVRQVTPVTELPLRVSPGIPESTLVVTVGDRRQRISIRPAIHDTDEEGAKPGCIGDESMEPGPTLYMPLALGYNLYLTAYLAQSEPKS
jgi:hypothetical protein